jgi:ubiquinone/menaquinone biosynthesis C-methylase UbiE
MKNIVERFCELPKKIRKPLWHFWHNTILKYDKDKKTVFLNYGYASSNGEFKDLQLKPEDETNRLFIQLYHQVAKKHKFENTHILEVGSGRGGGASFITRYFKPATYTAIDLAQKTIDFCNEFHKVPGLKFIKGDAENLPFENEKFDAVVNVESARCYPNIDIFFNEVKRVLKPEGKFLYADMIKTEEVGTIEDLLTQTGFKIIEKNDIRENVVLALKLDSDVKKKYIDKKIPRFMRKSFYEFAGLEGTDRYKSFANSEMQYMNYTLCK